MAQYAVLIYAADSAHAPDATAEDLKTSNTHADELAQSGAMVAAFALTPRDMATTYEETDWRQIVTLYDTLLSLWPSPVVALNRVVAVSMVFGPAQALAEIEELERDGRLERYPYLPAVKADLLRHLGQRDEAATAYRRALDMAGNEAERAYLAERLTRLHGS